MQPITNHAEIALRASGANCESTTSAGTASRAPTKWVDALLVKFHAIWGAKWAEQIEGIEYSALSAEWSAGIAGMSGEQIRSAIDHCRATMAWPPTIAEFRAASHGDSTAEQRAYAARAQSERPALPSQTWDERKRVGIEALDRIKTVLGMAQTTRVTRTDANIRAGLWTREMERQWRANLSALPWIQVPEITNWPESRT